MDNHSGYFHADSVSWIDVSCHFTPVVRHWPRPLGLTDWALFQSYWELLCSTISSGSGMKFIPLRTTVGLVLM